MFSNSICDLNRQLNEMAAMERDEVVQSHVAMAKNEIENVLEERLKQEMSGLCKKINIK